MSFAITAAVAGGITAATGIGKAIAGGKRKREARAQKAKEQAELEAKKAEYAQLDTSNPFTNMENMMEDMTVNQQQAEFQKEMQQQNQANIMEGMRGAAGGSGIAALAQTMASQGALASQQASASIGQQEQAIQQAKIGEASRLRDQEIAGFQASRQAEKEKLATLMGMDAADVEAQAMAEAQANEQMWSGLGDIGSGLTDAVSGFVK
jgi:hypothetical protein